MIELDPLTLMFAGCLANAASGTLLIGAWAQLRHARPLLWWAAANFAYAAGIGLLAISAPSGNVYALLAVALMVIPPSLIWGSVRSFAGRSTPIAVLIAGPLLWIAVGALTSPGIEPSKASQIATFLPWMTYLPASVWELWRLRGNRSFARYGLMALLGAYAGLHLLGIADVARGTFVDGGVPSFAGWFSLVYFAGLFYSIASAVLIVTLCKERDERRYIEAAENDSMTGINNRGAFLASAERILARCRHDDGAVSLIMFDLDRFKEINDTLGHQEGDRVIHTFVDVARKVLRPKDVFCRYGGEEFAVLLPGATIEAAYVIAERIRHTFAVAGAAVGGRPLNATVSGGVATASARRATLDSLLRSADRSLYRAKDRGRNRVERHDDGDDGTDRMARIA